jgi:hypothetical protein
MLVKTTYTMLEEVNLWGLFIDADLAYTDVNRRLIEVLFRICQVFHPRWTLRVAHEL